MNYKRTHNRERKKLYLLLLILPALACFAGNMTPAISAPSTATAVVPAASTSVVINNLLSPTVTQAAGCIVTVKSLNVRSDPESDVVGWLYLGDPVTILEDAPRGNWIKVRAGTVTGWIYSNYCKKE